MLPIIIHKIERRHLGAAQAGDFEQRNNGGGAHAGRAVICAADGQ
jgi:hypothetical protein